MRKSEATKIAFGGVMAALAVVLMGLGGLIPLATFVCPIFSMILLSIVLRLCDTRIGWAWYGAVAILGILLGPDKEASAVFAFFGYYPILKPKMDKLMLDRLWKFLFFNSVVLLMYWILINLLGLADIAKEFNELGTIMTVVTLILGNMIFFMLDKILSRIAVINKWGRK